MQKRLSLKILEVVRMYAALDTLINMSGISYKKLYWLDRNRKVLLPVFKRWQKVAAEITDKYYVSAPEFAFVSAENYPAFKEELLRYEQAESSILPICEKYEIKLPQGRGIPPEKSREVNYEVAEAAEKFPLSEIDIYMIVVDEPFEFVLKNLPGDMQLDLAPMLVVNHTGLVMTEDQIIANNKD